MPLGLGLPDLFLLSGLGLFSSVELLQEGQDRQRIFHDIFYSILFYIFCSSGGHFFFFWIFLVFLLIPTLFAFLCLFLPIQFFFVFMCYLFLRICFSLIILLIVSYSR